MIYKVIVTSDTTLVAAKVTIVGEVEANTPEEVRKKLIETKMGALEETESWVSLNRRKQAEIGERNIKEAEIIAME